MVQSKNSRRMHFYYLALQGTVAKRVDLVPSKEASVIDSLRNCRFPLTARLYSIWMRWLVILALTAGTL